MPLSAPKVTILAEATGSATPFLKVLVAPHVHSSTFHPFVVMVAVTIFTVDDLRVLAHPVLNNRRHGGLDRSVAACTHRTAQSFPHSPHY